MPLTLVTVDDIRAYTGLTVAQVDDAVLGGIGARAEEFINRACRRPEGFTAATKTEYVEGFDSEKIYITYSPITSITSIKVFYGASSSTTLGSTEYTFETDYSGKITTYIPGGTIHAGFEVGAPITETIVPRGTFPRGRGRKNIQVVYLGGYEPIPPSIDDDPDYTPLGAPDIPGDLKQAVMELSFLYVQRRNRDPELQSEGLGKYNYTRAAVDLDKTTGLPPSIATIIQNYVRYHG